LFARADANAKVISDWVARTPWIAFLASDPAIRSNTSVCLKVIDPAVLARSGEEQASFAKALAATVEKEAAGFDIGSYRDAPPGLRIWCGATIERADLELLTQWLDWAFAVTKASLS
jgi:phosphoserine aminotransferase